MALKQLLKTVRAFARAESSTLAGVVNFVGVGGIAVAAVRYTNQKPDIVHDIAATAHLVSTAPPTVLAYWQVLICWLWLFVCTYVCAVTLLHYDLQRRKLTNPPAQKPNPKKSGR